MTHPAIKLMAILAALILLVGAFIHMRAFGAFSVEVGAVESEFYRRSLTAMWIIHVVHWVFIAFISVGLSWYKSKACAAVLMGFGVWVLIDTLITLLHVGAFRGVYMLGFAGVLLLASGMMLRRQARASL